MVCAPVRKTFVGGIAGGGRKPTLAELAPSSLKLSNVKIGHCLSTMRMTTTILQRAGVTCGKG
jgi:hypothetical protein